MRNKRSRRSNLLQVNQAFGPFLVCGVFSVCALLSSTAARGEEVKSAIAQVQVAGTATQSTQAPKLSPLTSLSAEPPPLVNTAGTVRACNLANFEAWLNLIANGIEIAGIVAGSILMLMCLTRKTSKNRRLMFVTSIAASLGGLLTPGIINWFVAFARDLNLFS